MALDYLVAPLIQSQAQASCWQAHYWSETLHSPSRLPWVCRAKVIV